MPSTEGDSNRFSAFEGGGDEASTSSRRSLRNKEKPNINYDLIERRRKRDKDKSPNKTQRTDFTAQKAARLGSPMKEDNKADMDKEGEDLEGLMDLDAVSVGSNESKSSGMRRLDGEVKDLSSAFDQALSGDHNSKGGKSRKSIPGRTGGRGEDGRGRGRGGGGRTGPRRGRSLERSNLSSADSHRSASKSNSRAKRSKSRDKINKKQTPISSTGTKKKPRSRSSSILRSKGDKSKGDKSKLSGQKIAWSEETQNAKEKTQKNTPVPRMRKEQEAELGPHDHKHKTCMRITIRMPQSKDTPNMALSILSEGLGTLQIKDPHACILHPLDHTMQYYKKSDFPSWSDVCDDLTKQEVSERAYWNNIQNGKTRAAVMSAVVGSDMPPKDLVRKVRYDMQKELQVGGTCTFEVKTINALDTSKHLMMMGAPNSGALTSVHKMVGGLLDGERKRMMRNNPDMFPRDVWGGELPQFEITTEFVANTAYEERDKDDDIPVWSKRVLHLECESKDEGFFWKIFEFSMETKAFNALFGELAWVHQNPGYDADPEDKRQMSVALERHIALLRSITRVTLRGIQDVDRKFTLNLLPENGRSRKPVERSVRQVMMGMRLQSSEVPVIQSIILDTRGNYSAFVTSGLGCEEHKRVARNWANCPGGALMYYLLGRGVVKEDVEYMLRKCFTAKAAQEARESTRVGDLIFTKSQAATNKRFLKFQNSWVDLDLGITKKKRLEKEKQEALEEAARARDMETAARGDIQEADEEEYDFREGVSVKKKSDLGDVDYTTADSATLGDTAFEVEDQASSEDDNSFNQYYTDSDEEMGEKQQQEYHFENMPKSREEAMEEDGEDEGGDEDEEMGENPAEGHFAEGDELLYTNRFPYVPAKVVKVHLDDDLVPYYDVKLYYDDPNGCHIINTVAEKLKRRPRYVYREGDYIVYTIHGVESQGYVLGSSGDDEAPSMYLVLLARGDEIECFPGELTPSNSDSFYEEAPLEHDWYKERMKTINSPKPSDSNKERSHPSTDTSKSNNNVNNNNQGSNNNDSTASVNNNNNTDTATDDVANNNNDNNNTNNNNDTTAVQLKSNLSEAGGETADTATWQQDEQRGSGEDTPYQRQPKSSVPQEMRKEDSQVPLQSGDEAGQGDDVYKTGFDHDAG